MSYLYTCMLQNMQLAVVIGTS